MSVDVKLDLELKADEIIDHILSQPSGFGFAGFNDERLEFDLVNGNYDAPIGVIEARLVSRGFSFLKSRRVYARNDEGKHIVEVHTREWSRG